MTIELNRALLNSTLPNFGRVFTLIKLDNYFSSIDRLLDFDMTIFKTSITTHYSLLWQVLYS
jgi:hypothetical protein